MVPGQPGSQLPAFFGEETAEPFFIEHQHGQNRSQLNHHVKYLGQVPLKADQVSHNDHMAGGRNRNKLCQPFHNTQYDRN